MDDSLSVRKFVGLMLERAGLEVRTAADGVEALTLLDEAPVDVVVTDLEMPRVNGFELIGDMRRRPETRDIPVVVLTTRAGEKHLALARRLGVEHYVTKPVDEQAFVALVAGPRAASLGPGREGAMSARGGGVGGPVGAPVRVLVAGESRATRSALRRMLGADRRLEVVGLAADADEVSRAVARHAPDVIVLDVGMDAADAFTTIERVMTEHPIAMVVLSATTPEGGESAIRALELGAVDVLAKPSWSVDPAFEALAEELVRKVLAASRVRPARIAAAAPGRAPGGGPPEPARLHRAARRRGLDALRGHRRLHRRARRAALADPGAAARAARLGARGPAHAGALHAGLCPHARRARVDRGARGGRRRPARARRGRRSARARATCPWARGAR